MNRKFKFTLLSWVALMGLGCGSSELTKGRVPVFRVTGTITYQGSPVIDAVVNFVPSEHLPVATGKTDASGQYFLTTYEDRDGAAAGDYTVMVTKVEVPKEPEKEETGYPGDQNLSKFLLPEKYSSSLKSPLKATVSEHSSRNHFDFQLNK